VRLGITGHQDIEPNARGWIEQMMNREIEKFKASFGSTCLARGADQIFAGALVQKSIPFEAVIACDNIERSFTSEQDIQKFRGFLSIAHQIIRLNYPYPSAEAFFEASTRMVDRVNAVIAVWDGRPAQGFGGTADVVNYAVERGVKIAHLNPVLRVVNYIGVSQ
jgi:hypothetical protein